MGNSKYAYGWRGHIITNKNEHKSVPADNVVAIPRLVFERLVSDYENCRVDPRIRVEQIGVTGVEETYFLACGVPCSFSEGYAYYGTIFLSAENTKNASIEATTTYLAAMQDIYGVALPPPRLMVGCSSEN